MSSIYFVSKRDGGLRETINAMTPALRVPEDKIISSQEVIRLLSGDQPVVMRMGAAIADTTELVHFSRPDDRYLKIISDNVADWFALREHVLALYGVRVERIGLPAAPGASGRKVYRAKLKVLGKK